METLRTIIVEDERLARELLKKYLEAFPSVEVIGECSNGFDAIKLINAEKPDLIFLDVQMPKLNGFEMLELIDQPPLVIFTTAYNEYAIKAFEVNAVDYLMKPFSEERLSSAVDKAIGKKKSGEKSVLNRLPSMTEEQYLQRIVVKDKNKISVIPVDQVRYLEAQDDYVMIYTQQEKYLKQKTLKFYEDNLDPREFIRIHRSYIAAIKEVKQIELLEKDSYTAVLSDRKKLPVSKSGYERLKEIFS